MEEEPPDKPRRRLLSLSEPNARADALRARFEAVTDAVFGKCGSRRPPKAPAIPPPAPPGARPPRRTLAEFITPRTPDTAPAPVASRRVGYPAWLTAFAILVAAFLWLAVLHTYLGFGSISLTARHIWAMPNCAAAWQADVGGAWKGEPGYWPWLDRDRDGIACEWGPATG